MQVSNCICLIRSSANIYREVNSVLEVLFPGKAPEKPTPDATQRASDLHLCCDGCGLCNPERLL